MYLTNLVLICVVEANGPATLLVSRAQVAPKVLGSTPLLAVVLSYTCNRLSCFQRDAHGRKHVSWALGGTSRAAALRGGFPSVREKLLKS